MTNDLIELSAFMLSAWLLGYSAGLLILHIRKFFDLL